MTEGNSENTVNDVFGIARSIKSKAYDSNSEVSKNQALRYLDNVARPVMENYLDDSESRYFNQRI